MPLKRALFQALKGVVLLAYYTSPGPFGLVAAVAGDRLPRAARPAP